MYRVNDSIRIRQVRLIDDLGNQVGVVDTDEAKRMAYDKGLDLVEVSPDARPPVCKIMDYGKFKYDQKKKEHESRKRQHKVHIKEIRLRPKIGQHDQDYKLKKARQFLSEGDKVQLNMLFRGREMAHIDVGRGVLLAFAEKLEDLAKVERMPKMEGRRLTMLLNSTVPQNHKPQEQKAQKPKAQSAPAKAPAPKPAEPQAPAAAKPAEATAPKQEPKPSEGSA